MYIPGMALQNEIKEFAKMLMQCDDFKKDIANYIRMEIQASKNHDVKTQNGSTLSYEMLTRGNVNMQTRMAANGYDVYGKTIIPSNQSAYTNDNYYKKIKNKINYGSHPKEYGNHGQYKIG